jgi:hypothetical protein
MIFARGLSPSEKIGGFAVVHECESGGGVKRLPFVFLGRVA